MKVVGFCYKNGKLKIVLEVSDEEVVKVLTEIIIPLLKSGNEHLLKEMFIDMERVVDDLKRRIEAERNKQMDEMVKREIERLKTEIERLRKEREKGDIHH